MMVLAADGRTAVGRLRVRGAGLEPLVTRLRAEHVLGAADLRLASLPPSAILCVRSLRDPLPGTIDVSGGASRPPPRWELAATDALERMARQAARPAREPVPAGAEAVFFADRAELLAQLARDWCAGTLSACWWWRELVPGDAALVVVPAWLAVPTQIPAALAHLARSGAAVPFISRLDDEAIDALLHAVADGFAVPAVRSLRNARRSPAVLTPVTAPRSEAPWRHWAPETASAALDPVREAFLGVGLLLWRSPAAVRAPSFAEAIAAWSGDEELAPPLPDLVQSADMTEEGVSPHLKPEETESRHAARHPDTAPVAVPPAPGDRHDAAVVTPSAAGVSGGLPESSASGVAPTISLRRASHEEVSVPADVAYESSLDTAFGGLFYLLNLGIALELYGDFTMPGAPGIALSPWDFLALLGRRLIGDEMTADPIWPLLAGLAGRATVEEPGAGFLPPPGWRLPPEWLEPFEDAAPCSWSVAQGWLRVEHPAGFLLLDVVLPNDRRRALQGLPYPVSSRRRRDLGAKERTFASCRDSSLTLRMTQLPRRAIAREVAVYGEKARLARAVPPISSTTLTPLERWLDRLMPYLRARLTRALRVADADLPALLLRHRARVFVSAVNVDVILSLAELPIAIRLCGLDRDPGWLPAANRVVAFRFE